MVVTSRDHLTDEGSIPSSSTWGLVEFGGFSRRNRPGSAAPMSFSIRGASSARDAADSRTDVNRSPLRTNLRTPAGSELPGYGAHVDEREEQMTAIRNQFVANKKTWR